MMHDEERIEGGRRKMLIGLPLLAAVPLLSNAAEKTREFPRIDLSTREARLRVYSKLVGSLDGRVVTTILKGWYFAEIGGRTIPFYGVMSVGFARTRLRRNETLEIVSAAHVYHTDLGTGRPLVQWRNPVTGKMCDVQHVAFPAGLTRIVPVDGDEGADFHREFDSQRSPGARHAIFAAQQQADDVVFFERAEIPVMVGTPDEFTHNEVIVMRAKSRDLADPSRPRARQAYGTYASRQRGFRPWHRMGGIAGELVAHGITTLGANTADIPAAWIEETRRVRPRLVDAPEQELDELWREG